MSIPTDQSRKVPTCADLRDCGIAIEDECQPAGGEGNAVPRYTVWRSRLLFAIKVVVAAALLAWLILSGRLQLGVLTAIPFGGELYAFFALTLGSMLLAGFRWWWILRVQHLREPVWRVLLLNWTGSFAALVLPGAASGDLAKGYLIVSHRPQARARAFSTVLADRFLGLYSLLFLGCLAIVWFAWQGHMDGPVRAMATNIIGLLAGMTCVAGCLLFARSRNVLMSILPSRWRQAWNESFELYWNGRRGLVGCFLLSLASSAMTFMTFAMAGTLLGTPVSWSAAFVAGPLIVLANCLPLTPGGIGTAEAISSELFACFGSARGAEIMLLVRIAGVLLSLPGIAGFWVIPSAKHARPSAPHIGASSE